MTCPSPENLTRWVNERLDPVEQAAVAAHVNGCSQCQAALDALTAEPPVEVHLPDPAQDPLLRQLKETLPGKAPAAQDANRPPVPGYDLLEVLGRGGMGVVYRARQRGLDREVAIKLLHAGVSDSDSLARFHREGEALGRLRHPNVVQVFDVGVADSRPFLVMEYVPGGTLSEHTDGKPLPPAAAAAIAAGVAQAIQHAHEHGVLHRDLKPGNILLQSRQSTVSSPQSTTFRLQTGDSGLGTPKVADFGLARPIDAGQTLTQAGMVVGTPSYMAPEQVSGTERATPACDVYGIGAVLYELLTGRPPFLGSNPADVLLQVRDQDPVPPARIIPTLPRDLNTITLKCLAKDPRKRYPSAGDVAEDLRRWQAGEPIRARPVGIAERALKWTRRRKAAAALIGVGLFLLLIGLPTVTFLWLWADSQRRQAEHDRARAERAAYAGHIAQAEQFYRANDIVQCRFHLAACEPSPGTPDRRGWEWDYLRGLAYAEHLDLPCARREAHGFFAVTFDTDGKRVVAAGGALGFRGQKGDEPGDVYFWDAATGSPLDGPFVCRYTGVALAFTPIDRMLVVSSDVRGLNYRSEFATLDPPAQRLAAHLDLIPPGGGIGGLPSKTALAVSSDGTRVALGDSKGVAVYDAATWRPVTRRGDAVKAALVERPTGATLLTVEGRRVNPDAEGGQYAGKMVVTDLATGNASTAFDVAADSVPTAWAFSPSGNLLAWAVDDGVVELAHVGENAPTVRRLRTGHAGEVANIAFDRTERFLATGGSDGTARIWDLAAGRPVRVFVGHTNRVTAVAFNPAGTRLASVGWGPEAKVWDLTRQQEAVRVGRPRKDEKRRIEDFALSPDGRTIVAVRVPGGDVEQWDTATGEFTRLTNLGLFDWAGDMVIPGRMAAVSADGRRAVGASPTRLRMWTAGTDAPVDGPSLKASIGFVALSADGSRMAAAAGVGEGPPPLGIDAVVWDAATGAEVARVPLPGERCTTMALSADGRLLLIGTTGPETNPRIRIWDVDAGRETLAVPCGDAAWAVALDRDRHRLAASIGGPQPRIVMWDSQTGRELRSMPCLEEYFDLAFAPDGRRLAGASRQVMTLWDPAEGDEVMTLRGQPRTGNDPPFNPRVAFDQTGRQLAAAQANKTVMIWTATPRPVTPAH